MPDSGTPESGHVAVSSVADHPKYKDKMKEIL